MRFKVLVGKFRFGSNREVVSAGQIITHHSPLDRRWPNKFERVVESELSDPVAEEREFEVSPARAKTSAPISARKRIKNMTNVSDQFSSCPDGVQVYEDGGLYFVYSEENQEFVGPALKTTKSVRTALQGIE